MEIKYQKVKKFHIFILCRTLSHFIQHQPQCTERWALVCWPIREAVYAVNVFELWACFDGWLNQLSIVKDSRLFMQLSRGWRITVKERQRTLRLFGLALSQNLQFLNFLSIHWVRGKNQFSGTPLSPAEKGLEKFLQSKQLDNPAAARLQLVAMLRQATWKAGKVVCYQAEAATDSDSVCRWLHPGLRCLQREK